MEENKKELSDSKTGVRTYYDFAFKINIDYFPDELLVLCLEEAKRKKKITKYPKIKVIEKINTEIITGEKRQADTILKLSTKATTFIHIEYELKPKKDFNKRMWNYFRKIKNKYEIEGDIPILPIAIVIDGSTSSNFQENVFGLKVLDFEFVVINLRDEAFYKLLQKNYNNPTTSLFLLLSFIVREKITTKTPKLNDMIIKAYKILADYKKEEKKYLSCKNDFWKAISDILVYRCGYTIKEIDDLVREKGGVEMTFSEKILEEGLEKGKKEGLEKGKKETAKKMLEKGFDIDLIVEITGLSRIEIEKLK